MCFGMPIGYVSAPFMTNLFQFSYEGKQLLRAKNETCERLVYFHIFLFLQMTYVLSLIMNLKIITMIFILVSWNSKKEMNIILHDFFINNTFISSTRLKLAKHQANAKQQHETELLLLKNYTLSSFMLSSKTNI